jgi:hypothetical protein
MPRGTRLACILLAAAFLASPAPAAERELELDVAPSSAKDIKAPTQRVSPKAPERPPPFPWLQERLQKLPPFFADTRLEARFRTYYLRMYGPLEPWIKKTWRPGEIELVK